MAGGASSAIGGITARASLISKSHSEIYPASAGLNQPGVLIFAMGSPTRSWAEGSPSLLCQSLPGYAAAHTPGPARRALITISPAFLTLPVFPMSPNRTQKTGRKIA